MSDGPSISSCMSRAEKPSPGRSRMKLSVLKAIVAGFRIGGQRAHRHVCRRPEPFVRDTVTVRRDGVRELPVPRGTARRLRSHS